jgi:hypothetical protein
MPKVPALLLIVKPPDKLEVAEEVVVNLPEERISPVVTPVTFNWVPEMPPAKVEVPVVVTSRVPPNVKEVVLRSVAERAGRVEVAVEVAVKKESSSAPSIVREPRLANPCTDNLVPGVVVPIPKSPKSQESDVEVEV